MVPAQRGGESPLSPPSSCGNSSYYSLSLQYRARDAFLHQLELIMENIGGSQGISV